MGDVVVVIEPDTKKTLEARTNRGSVSRLRWIGQSGRCENRRSCEATTDFQTFTIGS